MHELLAQLILLFTTEMVNKSPYYFKSIHILDDYAMGAILHFDHMPALIITPQSDTHEQGPFSNTARERYQIRLRIVAKSVDVYAYQVEALSGTHTQFNVHILSDKIRELLFENKKLTDNTFEMTPMFSARDVTVIWNEASGQFTARDINIEYTKLEKYTGMQNEQDSLQASEIYSF